MATQNVDEEQWVVRATFYARLSVTIIKTTKTMVHTRRCALTGHRVQHSIEDTRPYRHERLRLGVNPLHGNLFFHSTEASARAAYAASAEKEAAKLRRAAQLFARNHTTTTTEDLDDEDSEISLDEG